MVKIISILLGMSLVFNAYAAEKRVNSKESLKQCREGIVREEGPETSYQFNRREVASSVKKRSHIHWINLVEISAEGKNPVRVKCETTNTGEIISLTLEPGRWKI